MIQPFTAAIEISGTYYDCDITPIALLRDYMSVRNAAEKSGYSRQAIEKMIKSGRICYIRDVNGRAVVYCPENFTKEHS